MFWGCDDPSQGTLDGTRDSDVNENDHAALLVELEKARARARLVAREARGSEDGVAAEPTSNHEMERAPMKAIFKDLHHFVLADAGSGGPEVKLFDAMQNPDRLMAKSNYFVAEGEATPHCKGHQRF